MMERDLGVTGNFTFKKIDVTKPETLKGLCDGAECVISTVGLTKTSAEVTNYQIDLQGNVNILNEAKAAGVSPQEFVDKVADVIRENYKLMNIDYDYFVRTTDASHEKIVQEITTYNHS